jgi:hypothetical protein
MDNLKFGFSEIPKPTPATLVKIGNALVGVSAFIAVTFAFLLEDKFIAISCMVMGALGKFLTMMFSETSSKEIAKNNAIVEDKVFVLGKNLVGNQQVIDPKTTAIIKTLPGKETITK